MVAQHTLGCTKGAPYGGTLCHFTCIYCHLQKLFSPSTLHFLESSAFDFTLLLAAFGQKPSASITPTTVDASRERHAPFNHFYCHLNKIFSLYFYINFSRELCLCTNLKSSALGRKASALVPWEGCFRAGLVLL